MKSFITKFLIPILSVATSGLLFEQFYLIQSSWESYYTWTTSNWLLYILCFISYYKCIFIKHSLPSHLPAPRHKHQIRHNHQLYTQVSFCDKQNRKYKPPRTSHCKINGCVARFDHYCPYINNPLCLRNLKAFFLFVGYGGFFALQFLILSLYNYVLMTRTGVNPFSEGEVLGWVLLTICSFILTIGMVGLFFGNLYFVSKNITQIDMMKGRFKTNDKQGTHPNPFDLGLITNFYTIFEGQLWTFWWPSQLVSRYDGIKFPMIPPISNEDKKELFANVQEMLRDPIQKSIPSTIQQLFQKEKDNHKNTIFFFLGEQYKLKQKIQLQEQQQNISQTLSNKKSSKQASEIQQQQKILEGVYDQ